MKNRLTVCEHPLLAGALAGLRDAATPSREFRRLMHDAGRILVLEALKDLPTKMGKVRTPLKPAPARLPAPVTFAAVLRAGLGFIPGALEAAPDARVGFIGLYRDESTLKPVRYYTRLPAALENDRVVLLDPMLATGGSAAESIAILKSEGARAVTLVSLLATKVGADRVHREHPDTRVVTAAVDPVLNSKGYIVPGLGDAGDRLFGT
ncbi:MAG TPA: uracil phosphoribosyltransferase [Elusimicrobiota bacterium]|jgi:uracil phosphoribosyltransferase|nr:uracil phosphoribosyltransferase [Elusimicrobiota bacterium]